MNTLNKNLNGRREKIRRIRVTWYKKKIGYIVVPYLERAMGMPINLCRVLSVGTGGGEDIEVLANLGIDSVGVDIDKQNAPFWLSKGLQCILADGRYLPFKERTFDCIIAIEIIEHVGQEKKGTMRRIERKKFARELMRVCAKGGGIFLSTPNKKFPIDIAHAGMDRGIVGGLRLGGLRFHSPWESFTVSLEELSKIFNEKEGCTSIFLVSPLGYVNWNWEFFTEYALIKHIAFPIGRLLVKLLDKLSCLRASFLNPHLILIVK